MRRPLEYSLLGCRRFHSRTEGMVAVEFAILGTVLILIIGGIIDLGHAYYMQQVLTNASREGARYGVAFQNDNHAARIPPSAANPSIQDYVRNTVLKMNTTNPIFPASVSPNVTVAGAGLNTGASGSPIEVTVSGIKTWWLISCVLGHPTTTLTATTVMQCE